MDAEIRVSTESGPSRRKFSPYSCRDSNPRPFNHDSSALTTELSPLPTGLKMCKYCWLFHQYLYNFFVLLFCSQLHLLWDCVHAAMLIRSIPTTKSRKGFNSPECSQCWKHQSLQKMPWQIAHIRSSNKSPISYPNSCKTFLAIVAIDGKQSNECIIIASLRKWGHPGQTRAWSRPAQSRWRSPCFLRPSGCPPRSPGTARRRRSPQPRRTAGQCHPRPPGGAPAWPGQSWHAARSAPPSCASGAAGGTSWTGHRVWQDHR